MEREFFKHPLFNYMFTHELFLKEDDPLKKVIGSNTQMFDYLIDFLRKHFPNPEIRQLCTLAWRLIGNQKVKVAMGIPIPTNFGFALIGSVEAYEPIVAIREDWLDYVSENRSMGLGAICLAASQCRDFWNGKILGGEQQNSQDRGYMYEAEMLLTLQLHEDFVPNDWQTQILSKFPKGIQSGRNLLYEPRREFMGAT